jgi:hypothetical protein
MDGRVALQSQIERREAVWRVPATTVGARARTRQGVMVLCEVTECAAGVPDRLDGIDSRQELTVDHAALDEDALGHRFDRT